MITENTSFNWTSFNWTTWPGIQITKCLLCYSVCNRSYATCFFSDNRNTKGKEKETWMKKMEWTKHYLGESGSGRGNVIRKATKTGVGLAFIFWPCRPTWGILVPQPGINQGSNPGQWQWKRHCNAKWAWHFWKGTTTKASEAAGE